jgi:restriction system protein
MGSFTRLINGMARDAARAQRMMTAHERANERAKQQAARALARSLREAEKNARIADRDAKKAYAEGREQETREFNDELAEQIEGLRSILERTLTIDDAIEFDSLRLTEDFPALTLPKEVAVLPVPPHRDDYFKGIDAPGLLGRLTGGQKKYEASLAAADERYKAALASHQLKIESRQATIKQLRDEHERARLDHIGRARARNTDTDQFAAAYRSGDPDAIVGYHTMVLERSEYPEGCPHEYRVAYVSASKELVIEYELPTTQIVPRVAEYRYVKTRDEIDEKPRKESECKELYADVIAAIALRTCHEVFESDRAGHIEVATFSGFVQTVDPATGRNIRPHLVSVRATRAQFQELDLSRIDKKACLRNLGAAVSPRPSEIQPIKPIVEFDMVDPRFVENSDVLSDLESRPNLMDLNPYEFEHLVSNLFERIGLETKLTRSSRDGGVDVVAFDLRPVLGGKVVIQAKRYRHTVGVSAVRDLYGTMMNEGANKGILVTTSGYGPDAFQFAKDKPIELMDGGKLLYLLREVGTEARIVMPEETASVV